MHRIAKCLCYLKSKGRRESVVSLQRKQKANLEKAGKSHLRLGSWQNGGFLKFIHNFA